MLDQPTSNTAIDIEILKATEAARNNVSILEVEAQRFEKLISTAKRELLALETSKKDYEHNIEKLKTDRENLTKEIDKNKEVLKSIQSQIATANLDLDAKKTEFSKIEAASEDVCKQLALEGEKLGELKDSLFQKEQNLNASVVDHTKKVDILKKALQDIC